MKKNLVQLAFNPLLKATKAQIIYKLSELQLKVNCRVKFGLTRPTVGRPAQFFSYNSLSVYN